MIMSESRVPPDNVVRIVNMLREAFRRKRYGLGEYDPDFDLFDVAADRIEALSFEQAQPSLSDFRQMVASIGVGIGADDKVMAGLMQAARIGWEYGSKRKLRNKNIRLSGS